MDSKMSKILMLAGILLMIGNASSFYNKSYDGYTFILPDAVMNHSNSRPVQLSFSEAQKWCMINVAGSTLATIPNIDVQRDFVQFIRSALQDKQLVIHRDSNIRLNGQYHITDEWRWVNGQPNTDITVNERNDQPYSFYGRLITTNFSIYSENSNKTGRFICEYPGNSGKCDLLLNGRCYKKKLRSRTWYDARNNCSDEEGDLASFETLSDKNISVALKNLSSDTNAEYWIGMQKNEWRWNDTGSAIKYTNWEILRPSNYSRQCLCLTQHQWKWKECDCSEPCPFICMINDTSHSPTPKPLNGTIQLIIITVSCASVFVVIIIIAAALITKRRRNNDTPRAVKSSGYENPEYAMTESSTDFPVYAEIKEPKETNCASETTYATVQMDSKPDEGLPASSIVYAELDLTSRA